MTNTFAVFFHEGRGDQIQQRYSGGGQGFSDRWREYSGGIRGDVDLREGAQRYGNVNAHIVSHSDSFQNVQ